MNVVSKVRPAAKQHLEERDQSEYPVAVKPVRKQSAADRNRVNGVWTRADDAKSGVPSMNTERHIGQGEQPPHPFTQPNHFHSLVSARKLQEQAVVKKRWIADPRAPVNTSSAATPLPPARTRLFRRCRNS
jgi:hypothetical protein